MNSEETGTGAGISRWTVAKYALAIVGLALVVTAPNLGRPWLGYIGIALIVAAFLLRFKYRVPRRPGV